MLILSRKEGQQIRIGDEIVLTVIKTATGHVRLGIEAPTDVTVLRSELAGPAEIPAGFRQEAVAQVG